MPYKYTIRLLGRQPKIHPFTSLFYVDFTCYNERVMMRIFNTQALSQKQRFTKAIILAVPAALGLGYAYGLITFFIPIRFSIVYIGIGWVLGRLIQKVGRGIDLKFSILAAALSVLSFLISDLISMVGLNPLPYLSLLYVLPISYLNSINGLLHLLFIGLGAIMAYDQARIL